MSDSGIRKAFGLDDDEGGDLNSDWTFEMASDSREPDDGAPLVSTQSQVTRLMETLTRIGGEVCRLRAEVDGLQESNKTIQDRFEKLRDVIEEKGTLNMDDFELACEVMNGRQSAQSSTSDTAIPAKKIAH